MTVKEAFELKKFFDEMLKFLTIKESDSEKIVQRKLEIVKSIKNTYLDNIYEISEMMTSELLIDDEKDLDACPICCRIYDFKARCLRSERRCKNEHTWHICTVHKKKVVGSSNNSIPMMECSCVH